AGGAFLPLDPAYPLARLEYMLQDSRTTILVVHSATLLTVEALIHHQSQPLAAIVCLDQAMCPADLPASIHFSSAKNIVDSSGELCRLCNVTTDDLAYLMYTSGSTGQPKGVPITHRNIGLFMHWNRDYFAFSTSDRIIQYHSLSFDFSTWEIFEALLSGACLHVVAPALAHDVYALMDYLSTAQITVL